MRVKERANTTLQDDVTNTKDDVTNTKDDV